MGSRGLLRTVEGPELAYWCQGCKDMHSLDKRWTFNGNYDKPTFTPSVHIKTGHYCAEAQLRPDGKCDWCEEAKQEGYESLCGICHSFVTDGQIQFLGDCTHKLKGQTVPMEMPPHG